MIVLDTNVLSELMRAQPDSAMLAWMDRQEPNEFMITAVTLAELLYGIARLPEGRRKAGLHDAAHSMLEEELTNRVLPFDEAAAIQYSMLVVAREIAGRPIGMADAQIAAICRHQGAALATRNGKDFETTGITVINPWTAV